MAKGNKLNGIAASLLDTFISRNNDIQGYWALGVLYKETRKKKAKELSIDLLAQTSKPPLECIDEVTTRYQAFLIDHMARQGLKNEKLQKAHIELVFNASDATSGEGDPCLVRVVLMNDYGKRFLFEGSTSCWQHDPSKERQSRRYDNL